MGYTRGGLGKSGYGIVVPVSPKMQTSRESIGYAIAIATSLLAPSLTEPRKVLFVVGGIHSKEQPTVNYVEENDGVIMPKLEPTIIVGVFYDAQGDTPICDSKSEIPHFVPPKQKI